MRGEFEGEERAEPSEDDICDWLTRAWTAWEISCEMEDSFGARSFGWIALGGIFDAIAEIESR